MKPTKILYVDDEAMALKYFERLVSPMAPVLTATSVEAGRAMLREHGAEIAVLVCDQRMPGEQGNELLRHTREYYPGIVRMLTTAYSELGDAIEAINTGEIYRYINKPWELESLRADLKNALELADLRSERDSLMRDKLLAQQGQLLASRLAMLVGLAAAVHDQPTEAALHQLARAALAAGCTMPEVPWHRWDHADLMQAEARRGVAVAGDLRQWLARLASLGDGAGALTLLAEALGGSVEGDTVSVANKAPFTALLDGTPGEPVSHAACAWLSWLIAHQGLATLVTEGEGWRIRPLTEAVAPSADWMAAAMEQLGGAPA
ncbi:response regulator [Hydrogenophaga sp.]|uniref:response regulator n=1 Tax=Hydrogenophaga sp. TaxID=1904254 RepID=UPI0025C1CE06|nr:response regulator [Hydrogenophaga sp.]